MKATQLLYFDTLRAWAGHGPRPRPGEFSRPRPSFLFRPGRDVRRRLWPYPSRALLGVVLLLGVCLMVACWNARRIPASSVVAQGFDLQEPAESPKVNSTSVPPPLPALAPAPQPEAESSKNEPPSLLPHLPARERRSEVVAAVKDEILPPPVVDVLAPPPVVPVVCFGPGSVDGSCFRDLHQGDTPMMRNWTILKLSSVMAVALAASPAVAGPTENPGATQTEEKLKDLEKKLDALAKRFDALIDGLKARDENIADLYSAVNKRIDALRLEIDRLQGPRKSMYEGDKTAEEILKSLKNIEAALKAGGPNVSYRPPLVGRIQLANQYGEEMLFVINGKGFRVAPFTALMLENQPAGVFTYEVISGTYGSRAKNAPTLLPGDTYTITVK
jgi:hypothetical protein